MGREKRGECSADSDVGSDFLFLRAFFLPKNSRDERNPADSRRINDLLIRRLEKIPLSTLIPIAPLFSPPVHYLISLITLLLTFGEDGVGAEQSLGGRSLRRRKSLYSAMRLIVM